MFQDEAPYLAEWIEFHRIVGVEHFFLYDHGSEDKSRSVVEPYVEEGIVTYVEWGLPWRVGSSDAQTVAYAHAIGSFGRDWRWMAFHDVDEFIFPVACDNLAEFLRDYEDVPALLAFWTMFGFSGHDTPPEGYVIDEYIMRAPFGFRAKPKSIVNPAEVTGVSNAHLFDLKSGLRQGFTEDRQVFAKGEGVRVDQPRVTPVSEKLRLNHYYTKSRRDFADKLRKRRLSTRSAESQKLHEIVEALEASAFPDDSIRRFLPRLDARMRGGGADVAVPHVTSS